MVIEPLTDAPPAGSPTGIDSAVLEAAKRGDDQAHAAIYSRYAARIFTLIYRLVPRRAQAEDLLHDTFVEVLRSISSYSGSGSFEGWLRSIAVNKSLMQLRSPWHRTVSWLDESLQNNHELVSSDAPPMDAALASQSELESALRTLPPTSRAVVWLHDVEGYTHGEIARALGRTTSFSKSQLARAHQRLRELLVTSDETLSCTPATHSLSTSL
jgi:RNA polymerase sigma-70 factor (ECF subfamily)